MGDFFKAVMFGATLPFRAVKEVAVHTVAGAATGLVLVGGGIAKLIDDDVEVDVEEIWDTVKGTSEKVVNITVDAAAVTTGVAALVSTGGLAAFALPAGIAAMCKSGSAVNSAFERSITHPEEEMDKLAVTLNTLGIIGGSAGVLAKSRNAASVSKVLLEGFRDVMKIGTLPFNTAKHFTPQYIKKFKRMNEVERTMEAAKYGLSLASYLFLLGTALEEIDFADLTEDFD